MFLPTTSRVRLLPNMRLWDKDEVALLFVLQERDFLSKAPPFEAGLCPFVLENRTPPLPRWVSGKGTMKLVWAGRNSRKTVYNDQRPSTWRKSTVKKRAEQGRYRAEFRDFDSVEPAFAAGTMQARKTAGGPPRSSRTPPAPELWATEAACSFAGRLIRRAGRTLRHYGNFIARCQRRHVRRGDAFRNVSVCHMLTVCEAKLFAYLPTATRRSVNLSSGIAVRLPDLRLSRCDDRRNRSTQRRLGTPGSRLCEIPVSGLASDSPGAGPPHAPAGIRGRPNTIPGCSRVMGLCDAMRATIPERAELLRRGRPGPSRPPPRVLRN